MKIEHLALWTNQLEAMKNFYCTYFEGQASAKYINHKREFESYFISFEEGPRLELMHMAGIVEQESFELVASLGLTHFAMSVGSEMALRRMTERFRKDGFTISSEIRLTGDGYLESVILDPDGNCVELTL